MPRTADQRGITPYAKSIAGLKKQILRNNKDDVIAALNILSAAQNTNLSEHLDLVKNWQAPQFPVTGADLIKSGMKSSKELGELLEKLKTHWEENNYQPNKDELLEYAKKLI